MWTHNCAIGGPTATESDQPCNWCNVTQEDIMDNEINKKHDKLEPVDE
ncbi:hypothetical protein N9I83_00085 [bacterium]|nr:hypothetical protein [bacterium]